MNNNNSSILSERLGRYHLLDCIALGGMAEIYRAKTFDEYNNEYIVAIKRILPQLASDNNLINMLIDEARISQLIDSPFVVKVYEFCRLQNEYFMVMELVDGKDLKTILEALKQIDRIFSIDDAVYITLCVLDGLHVAHSLLDEKGKPLNLVHRDMSPSNIILSYDGDVKICDFGIAKTSKSSIRTKVGIVRGKVRYMSPEQANARELDHRTDIYSVGAVLYEILTGIPAYDATNETELLKKVKQGRFAAVRSINPAVPATLQSIVHKAMAKDRNARYQTAYEFAKVLRTFLRKHAPFYSKTNLAMRMNEIFRAQREAEQEKVERYVFNQDNPTDIGVNLLVNTDVYASDDSMVGLEENIVPINEPQRSSNLKESTTEEIDDSAGSSTDENTSSITDEITDEPISDKTTEKPLAKTEEITDESISDKTTEKPLAKTDEVTDESISDKTTEKPLVKTEEITDKPTEKPPAETDKITGKSSDPGKQPEWKPPKKESDTEPNKVQKPKSSSQKQTVNEIPINDSDVNEILDKTGDFIVTLTSGPPLGLGELQLEAMSASEDLEDDGAFNDYEFLEIETNHGETVTGVINLNAYPELDKINKNKQKQEEPKERIEWNSFSDSPKDINPEPENSDQNLPKSRQTIQVDLSLLEEVTEDPEEE